MNDIEYGKLFDQDFMLCGYVWQEGERETWLSHYISLRKMGISHFKALGNTRQTRIIHDRSVAIRKCIVKILTKESHILYRWDFQECGIYESEYKKAIDDMAKMGLRLVRVDSGGNPTWGINKITGKVKKLISELNK